MAKKLLHFSVRNFISNEKIKQLTNFFFENTDLHVVKKGSQNIKINDPWKYTKNILEEPLSNILHLKESDGQNFFLHWNTNCWHVDMPTGKPQYHVVIPLWWPEDQKLNQKFLVANQYFHWGAPSMVWMADLYNKKDKFAHQTADQGAPYQQPGICNLVETDDKSIKEWYSKNYNHIDASAPPDYYRHLSFHEYDWNIGDVIIFSSNLLHNTTELDVTEKLGLALQFDGDLFECLKKSEIRNYNISDINYIDYI